MIDSRCREQKRSLRIESPYSLEMNDMQRHSGLIVSVQT
jgi:hypothetical protein